MSVVMVTANGEEHGMIKSLANSSTDHGYKHLKDDARLKLEKMRKEDAKIVKARYNNRRGMNERLTRPYCRYAGDRITTWHFIPGEVYDVPMGLINEVNGSPGLPRRSEVLDASGQPTKKEGAPERIHEFTPVAF